MSTNHLHFCWGITSSKKPLQTALSCVTFFHYVRLSHLLPPLCWVCLLLCFSWLAVSSVRVRTACISSMGSICAPRRWAIITHRRMNGLFTHPYSSFSDSRPPPAYASRITGLLLCQLFPTCPSVPSVILSVTQEEVEPYRLPPLDYPAECFWIGFLLAMGSSQRRREDGRLGWLHLFLSFLLWHYVPILAASLCNYSSGRVPDPPRSHSQWFPVTLCSPLSPNSKSREMASSLLLVFGCFTITCLFFDPSPRIYEQHLHLDHLWRILFPAGFLTDKLCLVQ